MGLLDDLTPPNKYRVQCHYSRLYNKLEPSDQQILDGIIEDVTWSNTGLAKALNAKGLEISHQSIARHRRKDCTCSKI
jgi:FixJ family two-component response regulator